MAKTLDGIKVENYRGLRSFEVHEFAALNIFVGPNNAGKSAVLEAVALACAEPNEVGRLITYILGQKTNSPAAVAAGAILSNGSNQIDILGFGPHRHGLTLERHDDGFLVTQPKVFDGRDPYVELPKSPSSTSRSLTGRRFRINSALPVIHDGAVEMDISDFERAGQHRALHDIVKVISPGLVDMRILMEGGEPVLYVEDETGIWPAYSGGDGFKRLIAIATALAAPRGRANIFEEPCTFLHSGAIGKLAQMFLAATSGPRAGQVFLSTHNVQLIRKLIGGAQEDERKDVSFFKLSRDKGVVASERFSLEEAELNQPQLVKNLGF